MDNPPQEIARVFSMLTSAASPDVQKQAIERYMTQDVGFRHPLCAVAPAPNSRDLLIGIYRWYRVMSPNIDGQVSDILYNEDSNTLVCDVTQTFHIRFSPFSPLPARLLVKLTLTKIEDKHYISFQEDFYHPDELLALVLPPLVPVAKCFLWGASVLSNLNASIAGVLGVWKPESSQKEAKVDF